MGPAGTNWDLVNISNTLTTGATFTIDITGPDAGNLLGTVANFDNSQDCKWLIADERKTLSIHFLQAISV